MKVNYLRLTFLCCTVLCSTVVKGQNHITCNGRYNSIVIGKSTLKDVEKNFGEDYKKDQRTYHINFRDRPNEYRTINQIYYPKLGITFNFFGPNLRKETVAQIVFTPPFKLPTENGIVIGKSKVRDVIERYGEGFWNAGNLFYSRNLSISYNGITFRVNKKVTLDEVDALDKAQFHRLKITEIVLNKPDEE